MPLLRGEIYETLSTRLCIRCYKTKSRFATLCALVRASVSLHLHLRTSRILACLCMRNNAPVEHCVAERFYFIGNAVPYDIKKNPHKEQLNFNASYGGNYFVSINLVNFTIIPLQRSNRKIHDRLDRMHAVLRLVEHQ